VVQDGEGEGGVERTLDPLLPSGAGQIREDETNVRGEAFPARLRQQGFAPIDAEVASGVAAPGQLPGQQAGAAPEVEHRRRGAKPA
jgi:hypothetical protein